MQRYKKSIKNIPINSIDYEKYLNSLEVNENLVDEEYIVFLDDYLPAHPDLIILGLRTVSSELYYNNINHFFRLLEKKMHAKVVVAAHPKSDYSDNPFENRKIFKYKTIELVKNCKFVIAQSSTSISFAVLYNKPLLFIYDNQLKEVHKTNLYPSLCSYAECLGCTPLNISDLDQAFEIKLPEINKKNTRNISMIF